ncbi:MAG TPA: beta-ketoacyl synthase N-terminal-like domain-containing protein [Polyangiaceae bacterium]|nr:beta-ketoacyl synthase N-terminal-like domain-containing protein [Polyangiaceae bacterium]
MRRKAVLGWGVVAPRSANVEEFAKNLASAESWLSAFNGFGRDNFLVGQPKFDFRDYQPWIESRFPPSRFNQLKDKMDVTTLFAVGAFIQALSQNPGIEQELQALQGRAHVYASTAIGAFPTLHKVSLQYYRAQRRWNRFWADPSRNAALREFLAGNAPRPPIEDPRDANDIDRREELEDAWFAYWAERSEQLGQFLIELSEIESSQLQGEVESGKLRMIRDKRRRLVQLQERWGAPQPPWNEVSANVLWNIANTPSAQISMMGKITGFVFAPVAACSTFSTCLKLALDAIEREEAKLVVIGCADPPPHPLTVGGFYNARVLSADGSLSKPLSGLKGTHVSGGAAIWIVGDLEYARSKGFKPLGLEPLAVGVSADADHIITPSREGPREAMHSALAAAGTLPVQLGSWDLHATATPGDFQELENLRTVIPPQVAVTARKGTFGHGMGVGGGWELTAQYLGSERGVLFPTPLERSEVHPSIAELGQELVFNRPVEFPDRPVGKLSMGVGGINACVISRPWERGVR